MNTIKLFYAKYIKRWVKAVAAAVGGAIAGLLINWVQGTTPIPATKDQLYTLLIATVLPPLLALLSPANKITQKQLDKDPNVIGGVVVSNEKTTQPDYPSVVISNGGGTGGGGGGAYARVEPINPPPSAGGWTSPYA